MKSGINFSTADMFLLEIFTLTKAAAIFLHSMVLYTRVHICMYVRTYMSRTNIYNYFIRNEKLSKFSSSTNVELLWPTSCSEGGGWRCVHWKPAGEGALTHRQRALTEAYRIRCVRTEHNQFRYVSTCTYHLSL